MVKILHILTRLIRGGADESTLETVAGLGAHHFKATLLIGGDSDREYVEEAAKVAHVKYEPFLRRDIQPFSDLVALYKLYKTLRNEKYTIVHTNTAKAGILGRFAARMAKVPIIVHTIHGITFHDFRHSALRALFIAFEKLAATMTDRFIVVGEDLQNYYLKHGIGAPEQYQLIHTGMDIDKFIEADRKSHVRNPFKRKEFGFDPEDIVIGVVSRLDPGKGQQFLLQAAPQIIHRFPHTKFLLVGDGKYRKTFEKMVQDLHLKEHVSFAGFRDDVEEMIALFDVAVFTSLWEGLPRVVVQYAAVGRPIVAFDIQGVSEIVKHGINGFTVPVKDVDGLAKQILYFLENPHDAIRMGKNGQNLIDNSWKTECMVSRIAQEYHNLLREKGYE